MEKNYKQLRLEGRDRMTLTLDNGTENAGHEKIPVATATKCYFARPYALCLMAEGNE